MLSTCLARDLVLNLEIQRWSWELPTLHPPNFQSHPACAWSPRTRCHAFQMCSASPGPLRGTTWEALTTADVFISPQRIWCHWSWVQAGHGDFKFIPGGSETTAWLRPAPRISPFSLLRFQQVTPPSSEFPVVSTLLGHFPSHTQCLKPSYLKIRTQKPPWIQCPPQLSAFFMCFLSCPHRVSLLPH